MEKESVPEASTIERKSLNWRGLTSLVVTLAFLMLATTGIVLYVSPQGRVANWTGWNVLGLGKEQWAAVHMTASLLFITAAGFHVYFNWQVLIRYLVLKRKLHLARELAGAVVVVAVVFTGTILDVPPFSSIVVLNDGIKAYWESRSSQAPYPHAEISTLTDFSERTGISLTVLQKRLAAAGITVSDPASQTFEALAHAHGLSPTDLFAKISARNTSRGQGSGLGRQTIRSLCERDSLPLEKILGVLQQQGFTASAESTLKNLAEQKGMSPADVRDLLVETNK